MSPLCRDRRHSNPSPKPTMPLYQRIRWLDWFRSILLYLPPVFYAPYTPLKWPTAILTAVYVLITGACITAGYHRLWAHRSYKATRLLRYLLAGMGAGALQLSIKNWVRHHRAHHRYTDTEKDPYNAKKGLLWSHMGWILFDSEVPWGEVDISDLENDSAVVWQDRHYLHLCILTGWILPASIAYLGWDDWQGGLLYGGSLRVVLVSQVTFLINSLAHSHWAGGTQPLSTEHSPRDNPWLALVTFGEGYHNFHHTFPTDYRNGARWNDVDMAKWCIWSWEKLGLASHLKRMSMCEIEEAASVRCQKATKQNKKKLDGEYTKKLPVVEWEDYVNKATDQGQRNLIALAGFVHDVGDFIDDHPGGSKLIRQVCGRDATFVFHGGVYDHSNHAHNLLRKMRVAVIRGGGQTTSQEELMSSKFVWTR